MFPFFGREFVQNRQEKSLKTNVFRQIVVEHRRFELLTPTLPVLCATNCANAPSTLHIISQNFARVNPFFLIFFHETAKTVPYGLTSKGKRLHLARKMGIMTKKTGAEG